MLVQIFGLFAALRPEAVQARMVLRADDLAEAGAASAGYLTEAAAIVCSRDRPERPSRTVLSLEDQAPVECHFLLHCTKFLQDADEVGKPPRAWMLQASPKCAQTLELKSLFHLLPQLAQTLKT